MSYDNGFYAGQDSAKTEIAQIRADAATVVYALDRSTQFIEALIAFLPEGLPLHPQVATCKAAWSEAMANLRRGDGPCEIERLNTALRIAGKNIVELNEHRDILMKTLEAGLELVDALLTEVARLPDLPMSLVIARNKFDIAVKTLINGKPV